MHKKLFAVIFIIIFTAMISSVVFAADRFLAKSLSYGNEVYFDGFMIDESNYFAIRDIAALCENTPDEFSLESDGNIITLYKNSIYERAGFEFFKIKAKKQQYAYDSDITLKCGDKSASANAKIINGRLYIKLRDIADILGFKLEWNNDNKIIYINGTEPITQISLHEPMLYDPLKPMVAMTFDDGPSKNTPKILDVLNKNDACATFFVVGTNASTYPDILSYMLKNGCQIGNHTQNHSNLTTLSESQINKEVSAVQNTVYKATGIYPTFLRPPYGSYNARAKNAIDMHMINWSIDTSDWKYRNAATVRQKALQNVKDGDVILMHDLYASTAEAVETIVPELKRRGFQMVTLEQLYEARGELINLIK